MPLTENVRAAHIRRAMMNLLEKAMDDLGLDEAALAREIAIDRSQVNRICNRKSTASEKTARAIEKLTGIPWHTFVSREWVQA